MLFGLMHNPCSTTIYTIWKETRSVEWTAVASLLTGALGVRPLLPGGADVGRSVVFYNPSLSR